MHTSDSNETYGATLSDNERRLRIAELQEARKRGGVIKARAVMLVHRFDPARRPARVVGDLPRGVWPLPAVLDGRGLSLRGFTDISALSHVPTCHVSEGQDGPASWRRRAEGPKFQRPECLLHRRSIRRACRAVNRSQIRCSVKHCVIAEDRPGCGSVVH